MYNINKTILYGVRYMEKKKVKKVLINMIIAVVVIIVIGLLGAFSISFTVENSGKDSIMEIEEIPKDVDAIIVLGAGVKNDGSPSDILVDRLKTAINVVEEGSEGKLLLTGDHGRENYNEVKAMKQFIKENSSVKDEDIFLDHAGFSTYDSIYRAKEVFKINKAVIVTNEYHLPRALFIAKNLGIDAYGVSSDIRNYLNINSYMSREKMAQIKDFIYCKILKPEPKFLGEPIPVNSSNGEVTDDEV